MRDLHFDNSRPARTKWSEYRILIDGKVIYCQNVYLLIALLVLPQALVTWLVFGVDIYLSLLNSFVLVLVIDEINKRTGSKLLDRSDSPTDVLATQIRFVPTLILNRTMTLFGLLLAISTLGYTLYALVQYGFEPWEVSFLDGIGQSYDFVLKWLVRIYIFLQFTKLIKDARRK